jgi:hypothetical protein
MKVIDLRKRIENCSEDDEREFDEKKNKYEPMEVYIRKQINSLIKNQVINIKKL